MISYKESRIIDLLPEHLKNKAEVQAISYAINKMREKVIAMCGNIGVYALMESLPEPILDAVAMDMRTPDYNQQLPIEIKRKLVENTLTWYMRLGTASVIEEYVSTLFGVCKIEEWYEYDGEPYTFRIQADISELEYSNEQHKEMVAKINKLKNVRSWLESISYHSSGQLKLLTQYLNKIEISSSSGLWCRGECLKLEVVPIIKQYLNQGLIIEAQANELITLSEEFLLDIEQEQQINQNIKLDAEVCSNSLSCVDLLDMLIIEKHLWRLNGAERLGGNKKIDAEIIYCNLEELDY